MSPSPCVIDYAGQFRFGVSPEKVWAAIAQVDRFEQWWGWLRDFRVEGPGLETGSVLYGTVAPPLRYRMKLKVVLGKCVQPLQVNAQVHGDLEGPVQLVFEPDGEGTRATVSWTIEMMQPAMRVAARLAHPLLRWGHDRVVDVTVAGFRRRLESLD